MLIGAPIIIIADYAQIVHIKFVEKKSTKVRIAIIYKNPVPNKPSDTGIIVIYRSDYDRYRCSYIDISISSVSSNAGSAKHSR